MLDLITHSAIINRAAPEQLRYLCCPKELEEEKAKEGEISLQMIVQLSQEGSLIRSSASHTDKDAAVMERAWNLVSHVQHGATEPHVFLPLAQVCGRIKVAWAGVTREKKTQKVASSIAEKGVVSSDLQTIEVLIG
jgi:hypothetical protein